MSNSREFEYFQSELESQKQKLSASVEEQAKQAAFFEIARQVVLYGDVKSDGEKIAILKEILESL